LKFFFPIFIFLSTLCALLFAPSASADEPILTFPHPPGITSTLLSARDFGTHQIREGIYNEIWTFEGYTDEGEIIRSAIGISEAFPWGSTPVFSASLLKPDGTIQQFNLRSEKEEFRAAEEWLDLSIRQSFFRGPIGTGNKNTFQLKIQEKDFGLSLNLICLSLGWRPPGEGRLIFGREKKSYWDISVLCPRTRFEGQIITPAGPRSVKGWGYIDHTYSNIRILEFSRSWISYRVHFLGFSLNFLEITATPKYGNRAIPLLALVNDNGTRLFPEVKVTREEIVRDEKTGYYYPQVLKIEARDGADRININLRVKNTTNRSDGLANLNSAERTFIKMFGIRPVGYTFANEAEIKLTLDGKTQEFKPASFHSLLIIN